jgi:endonuclease YncB( thermonuclease family)
MKKNNKIKFCGKDCQERLKNVMNESKEIEVRWARGLGSYDR